MQKTITIQETQDSCSSPQFSSDFPEELIGIIHPDEFQNSINNINRARQRTLCEIIFSCTLILSLTLAITLVTAGLSIVWLPNRTIWIVLLSVGTAIIIVFIIQRCTIRICHWRTDSRVPRMTLAIDAESMKYSTQLPVPIKWRLQSTTHTREDSDGDTIDYLVYSLLIDIGHEVDSEITNDALNSNPNSSQPILNMDQQNPIFPPPYSSLSTPNPHDTVLYIEGQAHIAIQPKLMKG